MSAQHPHMAGRFEVRINGVTEAMFTEITIPEVSHTPIEFREGSDPDRQVTQLIGMRKVSEGSLKAASNVSREMDLWFDNVIIKGLDIRQSFVIAQIDQEDNDTMTWQVIDALPIAKKTDGQNSQEMKIHMTEYTYLAKAVYRET